MGPPVPDATDLVGLLAEPDRLAVVAALALGATDHSQVAAATGLAGKDLARAVRRLRDGGLVFADGAELRLHAEVFKDAAQQGRAAEPDEFAGVPDAEELQKFIRRGRLLDLPVDDGRKRVVLGHVARTVLRPGETISETTVNERLTPWGFDPATLRRYLVDLRIVERDREGYRLDPEFAGA